MTKKGCWRSLDHLRMVAKIRVGRTNPDAKMDVHSGGITARPWETCDAGASWEPLTEGLPQENAYETVVRDALSADSHDRAGVYFGTRSGKVYASRDDGESWTAIADALPSVTCVKAFVVGRSGAQA